MRRHKHDRGSVRQRRELLRGLDPTRTTRHRDIEKDDVVGHALGEHQRLACARSLAGDLDPIDATQQVAQLRARGRLVVDDERKQGHAASCSACGRSIGTSTLTCVPNSGELAIRSRPNSP